MGLSHTTAIAVLVVCVISGILFILLTSVCLFGWPFKIHQKLHQSQLPLDIEDEPQIVKTRSRYSEGYRMSGMGRRESIKLEPVPDQLEVLRAATGGEMKRYVLEEGRVKVIMEEECGKLGGRRSREGDGRDMMGEIPVKSRMVI